MKLYLIFTLSALSLSIADFCETATLSPLPLDCKKMQSSAVTNVERRVEIAAQGFSVLPPQGEGWCQRLTASQGVSFYKVATYRRGFEPPRSSAAIAVMHMYSAVAMALKGFKDHGANAQSPGEVQAAVDFMLHEHLFAQILMGVITSEHNFRLVESKIVAYSDSGASCARFQATIEERGNTQGAALVFILNLSRNIVCRHPTAPAIGSHLGWLG